MRLTRVPRNMWHNIAVGWRLCAHATDYRSRLALLFLAATLTIKQRIPWRRTTLPVNVRLGGVPFRVRLGAHTDLEVLYEIAVRGEYDSLPCEDARLIVDLGAHIGLATLRLLAANPRARVIAVEPDSHLVDQLRANVTGFPVTVINAAVSDRSGPQTLYRSDVFTWANSLTRTMAQQHPVPTVGLTFAEILGAEDARVVDLLKFDIEGAEWDVFGEGLPESVSSIVGEIHARDGRQPRDLLDRIAEGFTVTIGREDETCLIFRGVRAPGDR
jgi:FkbM family methyltransferase